MISKSTKYTLLAGVVLCLGCALSVQANTIVTFSVDMATNIANGTFTSGTMTIEAHGTFNGWGALTLVQQGSGTVYTNTANDTTDANGGILNYKFVIDTNSYETTADFANRAVRLPAASGSTLVLPTPFYADGGAHVTNNVTFRVDMSQQINTGAFTNGSSIIEARGNFNGWTGGVNFLTNDPSIKETNQYGLVTSNVYTATIAVSSSPNAAMNYKFVENNNYEGPNPTNQDSGGNRFFVSQPLVLPVVFYGDAPFAPLSQVTFSVDMSAVVLTDTNYNPASVTINGDAMGWGGVAMTNNPAAVNTNIYYYSITLGQGSSVNYQYRYTQRSNGNTVYDHLNGANGGNNNRYYLVPMVAATNVPTVFFNDADLDDILTKPTPVFFSVDMTGAVGTDSHTFDPSVDSVYINGQFANWYAWYGGINPSPAPPGSQMIEQGLTMIYTNTIIMPAGTAVGSFYKYGMDVGSHGGPLDDEAAVGQNHFRVVRTTATQPYVMPADKFGNMYNEPYFSFGNTASGQLAIGAKSGGKVPVSWLGRPGAHLQTTTNLTSGWQDIWATDGTNWTSGNNSTNGFVSVTNWPAAGKTFFRLVKP